MPSNEGMIIGIEHRHRSSIITIEIFEPYKDAMYHGHCELCQDDIITHKEEV